MAATRLREHRDNQGPHPWFTFDGGLNALWCVPSFTCLFGVPRSASYAVAQVQRVNPAKVYVIDTGLVRALAHSSDAGRGMMLENLVFLHLRRQGNDIEYVNTREVTSEADARRTPECGVPSSMSSAVMRRDAGCAAARRTRHRPPPIWMPCSQATPDPRRGR